MRTISIFASLAMAALGWASGDTGTPTANNASAKKATAAAAVRKTVAPQAARTAVAKKPVTGAATAAAKRGKKTPVVRTTWRTRQTSPTSDRYRQIQEALVTRGYLSSEEANGDWGPSSADALKKFQAEQTLESTGKIDSLSLIALGLGPRHDSPAPRVADGNVQPESGHN